MSDESAKCGFDKGLPRLLFPSFQPLDCTSWKPFIIQFGVYSQHWITKNKKEQWENPLYNVSISVACDISYIYFVYYIYIIYILSYFVYKGAKLCVGMAVTFKQGSDGLKYNVVWENCIKDMRVRTRMWIPLAERLKKCIQTGRDSFTTPNPPRGGGMSTST